MGKFYEMFEMDAHIGAQELDLQYMKVTKSIKNHAVRDMTTSLRLDSLLVFYCHSLTTTTMTSTTRTTTTTTTTSH